MRSMAEGRWIAPGSRRPSTILRLRLRMVPLPLQGRNANLPP